MSWGKCTRKHRSFRGFFQKALLLNSAPGLSACIAAESPPARVSQRSPFLLHTHRPRRVGLSLFPPAKAATRVVSAAATGDEAAAAAVGAPPAPQGVRPGTRPHRPASGRLSRARPGGRLRARGGDRAPLGGRAGRRPCGCPPARCRPPDAGAGRGKAPRAPSPRAASLGLGSGARPGPWLLPPASPRPSPPGPCLGSATARGAAPSLPRPAPGAPVLPREAGAGGGGGDGGRLVLAARGGGGYSPHPALPSRARRRGVQRAGLGQPFAGSQDLLGPSSQSCRLSQKRAPAPTLVPLGLWLNFAVLASAYHSGGGNRAL